MRGGGSEAIAAGLVLLMACEGGRAADPLDTDPDAVTTTGPGDDETGPEPPPDGPVLPPRPDARHCRFDGWAPELLPPLAFEASPELPTIAGAGPLASGPDGVLYVGTDDGRVLAVDPAASSPATVERGAPGGSITGLAIDPTAPAFLFVRSETTEPARTRVQRFTFDGDGSLDPGSAIEVIAIDHDADARTGAGLVAEGGRLWLPLGDGGTGEQAGPAADPQRREGNLLRLEVAALAGDHDYQIPPDNPWPDQGGAAAESWATGLRDPAGCVLDPSRDRVWCVDAGANSSEADLVPAGADLGWPRLEGVDCLLYGGCSTVDALAPQATYRHDSADCGVGPAALGDALDPSLDGALVYADRCSGRVFAVRPAADARAVARAIVADLPDPLLAMAPDPDGGVWAIDGQGRIGHVVVRRPPGQFPRALSESGCFPAPGVTAPDLVPYELNAPLWTDGSHKQRHLVLPPGTRISLEDDGSLRFPEGTIILKTFSYALDPFAPEVLTPVETRVMIRRSFTWEFHTYAWDDQGLDAKRLEDGQSRVMLTSLDGAPTIVTHEFPSRDECGICHATGDVRALGPRLDQLDREVDYGGVVARQLDALAEIDLFEVPPPAVTPIADYGDPEAPLEDRARAYLHANCGHCHRPGGWVPPPLTMDLRWSTPTAETHLCNVPPQYASTFAAEHRVTPGSPSESLIWLRMSDRGLFQMPPVATSVPDPHADVVRQWIAGLDGCPP